MHECENWDHMRWRGYKGS